MSDFTIKKLILHALVYMFLGISNLLIKLVSFKKLIRLLSNAAMEFHPVLTPKLSSRVKLVRQAIFSVSGRTPWRSKCFEQAITASFILKALGVSHTVYFGLNNADSQLRAHAWLMVSNICVTGFYVDIDFTAVSAFFYTSKRDRVLYV